MTLFERAKNKGTFALFWSKADLVIFHFQAVIACCP